MSNSAFGSPVRDAQIITVRSVAAGAGRTVVAANLAFELAAVGNRVVLIDLDDVWPSMHRYFNLPQQRAAVLASLRLLEQQKLDANALEDLVVRLVTKGVSVDFLSGYGLNLNRDAVNFASIAHLAENLSKRYNVILIDAPAGLTSAMNTALATVVTRQIWVNQVDAVSLGRFIDVQAQVEDAAGGTPEPVLVLNRMRSSVLGARPEWQVQQVLRERTRFTRAVVIPDDDSFDQALLKGLPLRQLGSKSKALTAIGELALRLQ